MCKEDVLVPGQLLDAFGTTNWAQHVTYETYGHYQAMFSINADSHRMLQANAVE